MIKTELKIVDSFNLNDLKKFGFKLEPEKSFYFIDTTDCTIFIWITNTDIGYKSKHIYLQNKEYTPIISNIKPIYDLIKNNIVEIIDNVDLK